MIVYTEIDRERFDPGEMEWISTDANQSFDNPTSGRTFPGPRPVNERPTVNAKLLERLSQLIVWPKISGRRSDPSELE